MLLTTIKNLETGADWRSSGEESHEIIDLSHTGNEADFPGYTGGKEYAYQYRSHKRRGFNPWVGKIPWRRKWQPTPVFLLGESHGQRSLVGYGPEGCKESDTTEVI